MRHPHVTSLTFYQREKRSSNPRPSPHPFFSFLLSANYFQRLRSSFLFYYSWTTAAAEFLNQNSTGTVFRFKLRHFEGKEWKRVEKKFTKRETGWVTASFILFWRLGSDFAREEEKKKKRSYHTRTRGAWAKERTASETFWNTPHSEFGDVA